MSILSGQTATLTYGDNLAPMMSIALTCSTMLNDCVTAKVHNKVCKQLVTSICKTRLSSYDSDLFGVDYWDGNKRECYVKTTLPILVYTPPRGSRSAQINIINAIDGVDNLLIEVPGFCIEQSKYYVEVREETAVFDITDEVAVFKILYDNLRIN